MPPVPRPSHQKPATRYWPMAYQPTGRRLSPSGRGRTTSAVTVAAGPRLSAAETHFQVASAPNTSRSPVRWSLPSKDR